MKTDNTVEQNVAFNDIMSMDVRSSDGGFGYSMNQVSAGRSAMTFYPDRGSQYKQGEGVGFGIRSYLGTIEGKQGSLDQFTQFLSKVPDKVEPNSTLFPFTVFII